MGFRIQYRRFVVDVFDYNSVIKGTNVSICGSGVSKVDFIKHNNGELTRDFIKVYLLEEYPELFV